ncbi:MAG: nitroreductase family protein [bacterium]|nr:nitroreductase family protein [bacterium]
MNPVIDAILARRSCRDFTGEPLPPDHVELLKESLRWAPSAGNRQHWRFILVWDRGVKVRLGEAAYGQMFIAEAPLIVVVVALPEVSAEHYGDRGRGLYCLQDTAAAVQNLLLAAHSLGHCSCWVGAFDEGGVRRVLSLGADERPVALVPVGKGTCTEERTDRVPPKKVFHELP